MQTLARKSIDGSLEKGQRKTIRSEIPHTIKNVNLLLENILNLISSRRNQDLPYKDTIEYDSDLSEMQFFDTDSELEDYLPKDLDDETEPFYEDSDDDFDNTKEVAVHQEKVKLNNTKMRNTQVTLKRSIEEVTRKKQSVFGRLQHRMKKIKKK